MESSVDFLRRKGILGTNKEECIVKSSDGREFDLVRLMDEYAYPRRVAKKFMDLRSRRTMILLDIVSDDIKDAIELYHNDVDKFFASHPDWNTPYNRRALIFRDR